MIRNRAKVVIGGFGLLLGACVNIDPPPASMTVQIALSERSYCTIGRSPRMTLQGVPRGTTRFRVRAVNSDVILPSAWESSAPAIGNEIQEGALAEYRGPCPGANQYYRYRYTVSAQTQDGSVLDQAETTIVVPPLSALLQARERGLPVPTAPPAPRGIYPIRPAQLGDPSDPVFHDD
jgi:hypothetical protein